MRYNQRVGQQQPYRPHVQRLRLIHIYSSERSLGAVSFDEPRRRKASVTQELTTLAFIEGKWDERRTKQIMFGCAASWAAFSRSEFPIFCTLVDERACVNGVAARDSVSSRNEELEGVSTSLGQMYGMSEIAYMYHVSRTEGKGSVHPGCKQQGLVRYTNSSIFMMLLYLVR